MSGQEMNHMECQDARRWIQGYLDAELQEAQAAPLRKHLLDCQACRASAQSEKNLKRWFVEPKSVPVPRDFAARVARRAFAGDRGERFSEPVMAGVGQGAVLSMAAARDQARNLRFVLTLTAAAAAVLMMISLGIRGLSVPWSTNMSAEDHPTMSIQEAHQRLDQLNRAAVTPAVSTSAAPSDASTQERAKDQVKASSPASTPDAGAVKKPAERKQ
jgi:hypothetical protein